MPREGRPASQSDCGHYRQPKRQERGKGGRRIDPAGFDGGKKINGVKVHLGVDKYGIPLAIDVSPANVHDTKGIIPVLRELSGKGFRGSALGDLGYRGKRLAKAGRKLGITAGCTRSSSGRQSTLSPSCPSCPGASSVPLLRKSVSDLYKQLPGLAWRLALRKILDEPPANDSGSVS